MTTVNPPDEQEVERLSAQAANRTCWSRDTPHHVFKCGWEIGYMAGWLAGRNAENEGIANWIEFHRTVMIHEYKKCAEEIRKRLKQ